MKSFKSDEPIDATGMNLLIPKVITSRATFASGCFWGVEALFGATTGVISVKSGYTGGTKVNPTYHSLGDHTEAVDIQYDPKEVSYDKLLKTFWDNHDPTDFHSRQYMSAIYYHNEEQKDLADRSISNQQIRYQRTIKTELVAASTFYDAEEYHQKYYLRHVTTLFGTLGLSGKELNDSYVAAKLNGYIAGYGNYEEFVELSKSFGLSEHQREFALNLVKSPPFKKCH